jgi:serine/threonine-protein kinase
MSEQFSTPGQLVAERFRVERVLGEGGMGIVLEAHDLLLDRTVAIKIMRGEATRDERTRQRFFQEARAAASLQTDHVVRVLDIGTLPGGEPFIVMERLVGHDLETLLEHSGPLPIPQLVDYVLQALVAIGHAHSRGIIHRDLKPPNIFVTTGANGQPVVKVLDFGVAKATGDSKVGGTLTQTSQTIGSPRYMAPEQLLDSRNVDARTDIWSIGVVLFELATGKTPFEGERMTALAVAIVNDRHPRLTKLRPDAPPVLEAIIDRCLQKYAPKRFANVTELADALLPLSSAAPSSRESHQELTKLASSAASRDRPQAELENTLRALQMPGHPTVSFAEAERATPPGADLTPTDAGSARDAGPLLPPRTSPGRRALLVVMGVLALAGTVFAVWSGTRPLPSEDGNREPANSLGSVATEAQLPPPALPAGGPASMPAAGATSVTQQGPASAAAPAPPSASSAASGAGRRPPTRSGGAATPNTQGASPTASATTPAAPANSGPPKTTSSPIDSRW